MAPTSIRSHRWRLGVAALSALAAAAVVVALATLGGAGTASADAAITLTPASGPAGTGVQLAGSGFPTNTTVTVMWDRSTQLTLASVTTSGTITSFFLVPQTAAAGTHSVQALAYPAGVPLPTPGLTLPGQYSPAPGATPLNLQQPVGAAGATFTVTAGAATPTPLPTPSPSPIATVTPAPSASSIPSPSPSGTPGPTPTPFPTPTPQPFGTSLLDMAAPCIPESAQSDCDSTRTRLWTADLDAWKSKQAGAGQPVPTADDAFKLAFALRVNAGDPAAVSAVARGMGWPHIRIGGARYRGTDANGGDWIEVRNIGGAPQEMTGWSVRVGEGGARFQFQDGFTLAVGGSCRVSVNPPAEPPAGAPKPCAGTLSGGGNLLPDDTGVIQLWVDYFDLKVNEARYAADPNHQPAPPNLQGIRE